jgi:NADPH:quinone reductase-like Zn-dependent oxidoreductase
MRAVAHERYGEPRDVLRVREVRDPVPGDGEVLLRVRAAAIHIGAVHGIRGVPYLFRPMYGLRRPKAAIPGTDVAGTIEAVGRRVEGLEIGDEVFGWCTGAFAERAAARVDRLAPRPVDLPVEQASALGTSATVALQALRDHGRIRAGHRVLINGASGGVGTSAVQIAKAFGAQVTAVCSMRNADMVASIGADHVIDYGAEDFTHRDERYDIILDNVGTRPLSEIRRALAPGGVLLSNGAPVGGWTRPLGRILTVLVSSWFVREQAPPIVHAYRRDDLIALCDLVQAGTFRPVIDRTHPLAEAAEAVGHVADGHARGTTVITM